MATIKTSIGHSPLSDKIYIGKQNQDKGMWIGEKRDITNDFIATALSYFGENTIRGIGVKKGEDTNLLINIKNDPASIDRLIKALERRSLKLKNKLSENYVNPKITMNYDTSLNEITGPAE